MLFRNIKLLNYPGFKRIDLNFNESNVLFITSNNHTEILDDIISEILTFFLMLPNPTLHEYLYKSLKSDITTFYIEFEYEEKEYCYYLQISKKGIHSEELYEDNNIVFQNKNLSINPSLPNPVRIFLNKLIIIDLTRELWIRDLISESVIKCNGDPDYLDIVCTLFKNFNLVESVNDIRLTGDSVYIYGKSIQDCSYNLRVIFGLIPLFIECIGSNNIMFLHGFDIDIDMKSKINLLNLFVNKEINTSDSQLIFSDQTNYDEYSILLKEESKFIFVEDDNKDYTIKPLI